MGDIPAQSNMVSTVLLSPQNNEDLNPDETFTVELQIDNLEAGFFTNPDVTYYAAPQQLNGNGIIQGHVHVTIQDMGSANPQNPPNAAEFAFFKGINDPGNGNGRLSTTVDGGLSAGFYRICTMSSSSNHQPVLMPVSSYCSLDIRTTLISVGCPTRSSG